MGGDGLWDEFAWRLGDSGIYTCLVLKSTFLLVLIEAVNIGLIFQNQKYSSCRVDSFPLEVPITLPIQEGKNGWQMYLLLILSMYSTFREGKCAGEKVINIYILIQFPFKMFPIVLKNCIKCI